MKEVIGYEAIHIQVDCERNDSVDVRCGGPSTLGYDFYIDSDLDINKEIEWIKSEIKKAGQQIMSIQAGGKSVEKKVWTHELIKECIQRGY